MCEKYCKNMRNMCKVGLESNLWYLQEHLSSLQSVEDDSVKSLNHTSQLYTKKWCWWKIASFYFRRNVWDTINISIDIFYIMVSWRLSRMGLGDVLWTLNNKFLVIRPLQHSQRAGANEPGKEHFLRFTRYPNERLILSWPQWLARVRRKKHIGVTWRQIIQVFAYVHGRDWLWHSQALVWSERLHHSPVHVHVFVETWLSVEPPWASTESILTQEALKTQPGPERTRLTYVEINVRLNSDGS